MYGSFFYGGLALANDAHCEAVCKLRANNQPVPLRVQLSQLMTSSPVIGAEVPIPKGTRL